MKKIPDIVNELKDKFSTNNPFELCDLLGIIVLKIDLPENINGFFHYNGGRKCIYINNSLSKKKAEFCCAHELGHAILHNKMNTLYLSSDTFFHTEKFETQADTFASFLLFDDADILYEQYGLTTQSQICSFYGIDERIAKLRYEN